MEIGNGGAVNFLVNTLIGLFLKTIQIAPTNCSN